MSGRFTGRSVLVTGASRGLGRAIALAFASEGARVGIAFRTRAEEAALVASEAAAAGGEAVTIRMDVRDAAAVREGVAGFAASSGLHAVVNNAAVVRDQLFPLLSATDWDEAIAVTLTGTYLVSHAAIPHLIRSRGAIVNVSSVAALRASPGQANYAAAKGGVLALTTTLAAELAPRGVRVNAVVPGLLATGMGERLDHRVVERRRAAIPLGRLGSGNEVARVVVFLASDDAAYIVGQHLVVDGGLSL